MEEKVSRSAKTIKKTYSGKSGKPRNTGCQLEPCETQLPFQEGQPLVLESGLLSHFSQHVTKHFLFCPPCLQRKDPCTIIYRQADIHAFGMNASLSGAAPPNPPEKLASRAGGASQSRIYLHLIPTLHYLLKLTLHYILSFCFPPPLFLLPRFPLC